MFILKCYNIICRNLSKFAWKKKQVRHIIYGLSGLHICRPSGYSPSGLHICRPSGYSPSGLHICRWSGYSPIGLHICRPRVYSLRSLWVEMSGIQPAVLYVVRIIKSGSPNQFDISFLLFVNYSKTFIKPWINEILSIPNPKWMESCLYHTFWSAYISVQMYFKPR